MLTSDTYCIKVSLVTIIYFLKLQLQKTEEINVDLAPGTYAVSAGAWGSDRQHTHVVHVKDGQTVDLNFGL